MRFTSVDFQINGVLQERLFSVWILLWLSVFGASTFCLLYQERAPFYCQVVKVSHLMYFFSVAGGGDYFQFWDIEDEIVVFLCKSFCSCPPPFPSGQYPEVEFLSQDVGICLTL